MKLQILLSVPNVILCILTLVKTSNFIKDNNGLSLNL